MDSIGPAFDAVTDDIGFALLRQFAFAQQSRELVHVSLFDRKPAAAAAEQKPFRFAEDLQTVTVGVATVVGFGGRLQDGLTTELEVAL